MWDPANLTEEQELIRAEIRKICADFDREYWRRNDANHEYPEDFADVLATNGWLGVLIPEEYGGAGMGTSEAMVVLEEIAASGAGYGGAQAIHGAIYTSTPIIKYASEELKADLLPKLARGEEMVQAFGLTEPNAGSESTAIETTADRDGDEYVLNGQKIWTSRLDVSDHYLVVARTTPKSEVERKTEGISLLLVDLADAREQDGFEARRIPKTAFNLSSSFEVWFDDLRVPAYRIVGEEGKGFYHVLDGLNEERLVIAAEALGHGRVALERASDYAVEREVFDRSIGQNQAVQHPLAEAYAHLQAAKEVVYSSAELVDELDPKEAGLRANVAKYLAAEAAYMAADAAVQVHGGFGVAREYDVERFFRDARVAKIAPVTHELILSYVAENALDLPRSY